MTKNKRVWFKLDSGFFNNCHIKEMKKLENGDTYIIIYLKMILLSLNNNGLITHNSVNNDLSEQIALKLDEDVKNVKAVMTLLEDNDLIKKMGNRYFLKQTINNISVECSSRVSLSNSFTDEQIILTKHLIDLMLKNNSRAKVPKSNTKLFAKWALNIKKLNQLDGYSYDEIKELIDFSQSDNFWSGIILSTGKLRKQAGALKVQKDKKPIKGNGGIRRQMERMKDW